MNSLYTTIVDTLHSYMYVSKTHWMARFVFFIVCNETVERKRTNTILKIICLIANYEIYLIYKKFLMQTVTF